MSNIDSYLVKTLVYPRNLLGVYDSFPENPGGVIGVGHGDMLFLDHILSYHQNITNIIEFGTWAGVTSMYLGLISLIRNGTFITFDIEDLRLDNIKQNWLHNMQFVQADILSTVHPDVVNALNQTNLLWFVDNGNKIQEVKMYHQYVPTGTIMVVHDWGDEVTYDDIAEPLENFTEIFNDIANMLCSSCRVFCKR